MEKETLAKRVEPLDATVSQIIRDEAAKIETMATPFLRDGKIHKVSKFAPTRLIVIYIGIVGDDFTRLIGGDAERYFEFIGKAGVNLNNDESRRAYLLNYLEVTKAGSERLQILESVENVKMRPNLNDEQKRRFAEFQEKYRSVIKPPKQNEQGVYQIFVIRGQNLVRFDLTIKENDSIEERQTVLEKDILIPYAL